jgi:hypothetical protein
MALIFDRNVPAGVVDLARSTLGDLAAVPDSRGGRSPLATAIVSDTPARFLRSHSIHTLRGFLEIVRARAVQRLRFNNSPREDDHNPPPAQEQSSAREA